MATRIPQPFIDDLLDRADIVEVIDRRVALKKSGRNYMACCPFHDEKSPSFSVNPDKQFYYCFGCGAGGNAIGFLMDYERLDFPRAVETLAESCGLEVPREATAFREEPQQKRSIYQLLEKAADYYQRQLREHPQRQRAVDYLKNRGLSGETARDFGIGYAPPGWDNLLKALATNDDDRQLLIDGGMLIDKPEENKCYDRFRDRIIFPIKDNRGRVIAFGGRVLGDDKPKYLNSPETPVFHKNRELYGLYQARQANRQLSRMLIVEGYMDVVALAQKGISWSAATLGTATSTEHLNLLFRHCPEVIFCFDGDEAGRKAAARALESALPVMEDGRQARFMFLPQGEDPDSWVRAIGAKEFERQIDLHAAPLEQYLFDSQSEGIDTDTLEGKARLGTLATPLIQRLPEGIFKSLMFDALAQRTGLGRDRLEEIIQQQAPATAPPAPEALPPQQQLQAPNQHQPRQRHERHSASEGSRNATLYAIGLLILHPTSSQAIEHFTPLDNSAEQQLLADILALTHKRPESTTYTLLGNWLEAPWKGLIEEGLNQAQIFGVQGNGNADKPEQELADTIKHLKKRARHAELEAEIDKITRTDYASQTDEQKRRLVQLLSERHKH